MASMEHGGWRLTVKVVMEINILLGKVPPKSGAPVGAELAGIRPFRHAKIKKHYMLVQNCKRWIMIWRMTLVIYFYGWFQIASIWTSCDLLLVKIWAHHYLQRCIWVPLHDMLDIKFCIAFAMPSPQDPSRQLGAPVDYYKAVHSAYTNQYLEAQALKFWQAFFFAFFVNFIFCVSVSIFCEALGIEPLDRHRRVQLLAQTCCSYMYSIKNLMIKTTLGIKGTICCIHFVVFVIYCIFVIYFVICLFSEWQNDLCQVVSLRAPLQKCTIEAFPAFPTSRRSLSEAQPLVPSSGHLGW